MTKKRIIGLLAALVAVGVLAGFAIWIVQFDVLPEDKEYDSTLTLEYKRQSLVIYSCVADEVDNIHVINQYGEYQISKDKNGNLNFLGREGAPLLPYSSSGLYESVQKITCEALIETESQNLEWYGLDEPQVVVTVTMKDGSQTVLNIGDAAPQGGGYYIRDVSNTDIYLAQTYFSERFLKKHTQYYETTISKEFDYTGFQSLSIVPPEGSDNDEIFIRMTTDEEAKDIQYTGGMVMEKPFMWGGDSTPIQEICEILAALKADEIVTDTLDETLQAQYGFDNPTKVVVEMWVNTSEYVSTITGLENPYYGMTEDGSNLLISSTYLLGNIDGRTLYVMYDGEPVIYSVDIDKFAFVDYPIDRYCQRIISLRYLNELNALTVEFNGDTYNFSIKDPDAGDDMVVMYDDYTKLKASLFRSFYVSIIGVTHDGLGTEPEEGTQSELTITLGAIDGHEYDTVLEFIPISERKCVLKINGEGRFFVYVTKVNKIKNDMMKLLNGDEIMN